jgi:TPR repeat protein
MRWLVTLEGIFRSPPVDFSVAWVAFLGAMPLLSWYRKLRAARNLRRAAEAGNSEAAFRLGLKLGERGQEQQRLDWLRRAAELARDEGRPASRVAYYLHQAGQDEQAEDTLRQAAGNGDATAAYDLGSMLTDAGRREEGERYYRLAAERGNSAAARYLGVAALRAGRGQEAEPYLRAVAEGGIVEDQFTLVGFLVGQGRTDEAVPLLYKIAGQRFPGGYLRRLGSLFRRAGLEEEARKYYDRADEWDKLLDSLDGVDDAPP